MPRLIRLLAAATAFLVVLPVQLTATSVTSSAAAPSWEQLATPGARSSNWIAFFGQQHGWLETDDSRTWRTSDGGASWTSADAMFKGATGCSDLDVLKPSIVGSSFGWAPAFGCGQKAWLFSTSDGGNSWRAQALPAGTELDEVDFQDALHGWASGATSTASGASHFVEKTEDSGAHWTQVYSRSSGDINHLRFLDQVHGVASLYTGNGSDQLMATSDGGASWAFHTPAFASGTLHYRDLAYPDSGHMYAAANDYGGQTPEGLIDRSSNHGATWDPWVADLGVGSVAFLSSSGWAAGGHTSAGGATGGGAVIDQTTNAGASWTRQYENAALEAVVSIYAVDSCHAWAAGGWSHPFLLRLTCPSPTTTSSAPSVPTSLPPAANTGGAAGGTSSGPSPSATATDAPGSPDGSPTPDIAATQPAAGAASIRLPSTAAADRPVPLAVTFAGADDQVVAFAQDAYAPLVASDVPGWSAITDAVAANCAIRFQPVQTRSSATGRAATVLTLPAGCRGVFHVSAVAGGERLVAQIRETGDLPPDDRPVILAAAGFVILNVVGFTGAGLRRRRRRRATNTSASGGSPAA